MPNHSNNQSNQNNNHHYLSCFLSHTFFRTNHICSRWKLKQQLKKYFLLLSVHLLNPKTGLILGFGILGFLFSSFFGKIISFHPHNHRVYIKVTLSIFFFLRMTKLKQQQYSYLNTPLSDIQKKNIYLESNQSNPIENLPTHLPFKKNTGKKPALFQWL